ncbi:MAG: putative PEP-binding protein [Gemmataceae bacterium]
MNNLLKLAGRRERMQIIMVNNSYDRSLLLTLGEITQLVVECHDPAETLANIVRLVQQRFNTAVCSMYVLDPDSGDLVLAATVGLKPEAIGRVRMPLSEGLTGLVGQLLTPVNVSDASQHPRFKYFPEAGEDRYHSFLGVPLLEAGTLEGVLVLQTIEARTFSPNEVRTLTTVAAQLAPLVGDAQLLERITAAAHHPVPTPPMQPPTPAQLSGSPLSPGMGIGQAYIVDRFEEWRRTACLVSDQPERERERLAQAFSRAREEITRLSKHISELVGEDHGAILQAQLMIMQDRNIEQDLQRALERGASAEGALFSTLDQYVAAFARMTAPMFRERVYDMKDVFHRLLWQLRDRPDQDRLEKVVLVSREASVMELFAVDLDQLAGVVVEQGGPQSHAAILARSLNIPMVGKISDPGGLLTPGRRLLVDGSKGTVVLDPPTDLELPPIRPSPQVQVPAAVSGMPKVEVNVNLLYEAQTGYHLGAAGVGLYRSEFLFLARRTLPTEDEQVTIYRKLIEWMKGRPVTIRTFDLRPDKLANVSHMGPSATRPFDWRIVLQSPPLQKLFSEQIRAILRAATAGTVRILIPLVTRSEVLDFVFETLARARESLAREGLDHVPHLPVGVMIEVPAAVPLVPIWADQVDFFALGTNDLTASAMGVDRDDPIGEGQLDSLHPGLLRLIHATVRDAHAARRSVSVCGELAADPIGAMALVALEVDSLSVPVQQFAATREALARIKPASISELKPQLLRQRSSRAVRTLIAHLLQRGSSH